MKWCCNGLQEHIDSTDATPNCEYIFKYGHFTVADNDTTPYACNMTLKRQPAGSAEPYLVVRDDMKYP